MFPDPIDIQFLPMRFVTCFSLIYLLFGTNSSLAQWTVETDFSGEKNPFLVSGMKYEPGVGLNSSGGWLTTSWATFEADDAIFRDGEIAAEFRPYVTGNKQAYAELLFRTASLEKSGTGVRIYGGNGSATVALVDHGTEIRSENFADFSPASAGFRVEMKIKGDSIRAKIIQGEKFEDSISGKIKEASEDGYFLFRAVSANEGPILSSLRIAGEGNPRIPSGVTWPPDVEPATTTPAPSTTSAPAPDKNAAPLEIKPYPVPVRNFLLKEVRVLSPELVCLVLDSAAAVPVVLERDEVAQKELAFAAKDKGSSRHWYYEMANRYVSLAAIAKVRAGLVPKLGKVANWRVNGQEPDRASFFPSAIDAFPVDGDSFSGEKNNSTLRVAEFVYLKLAAPIEEGGKIRIQHRDGLQTEIGFSSNELISPSIKVNQVGYLPTSKKFAYLGMWAGFDGAVDFSSLKGQAFTVRPLAGDGRSQATTEDREVFSGTIELRSRAADQTISGSDNTITGDDVYEMDFSELTAEGRYCIHISGLGRSWPFQIGEDIYAEAFYHTARSLYHQRGTIPLEKKFTAWTRGRMKQPILKGGFLPETDRWYDKRLLYAKEHPEDPKAGFRDEQGNPLGLSPFTMVKSTATEEPFPGLEEGGGWHDAADYDRRVHHYNCVWDLCGVYEMYPSKFKDGQLHVPESGNGVPDILDEAAVQVDFFLKTQQPDGGVSSWAEQVSHPHHEGGPEEDTEPLYVSLPDRVGSLQFSACAAYLGRLIEPFDAGRSQRYLDAAKRAFAFGNNPDNRIRDLSFVVAEGSGYDRDLIGKKIIFNEAEKLKSFGGGDNLHRVNALVQLAASGSAEHREMLQGIDIPRTQREWFSSSWNFYCVVTPLLHPEKVGISEQTRVGFLEGLAADSEKWCHGGQDDLAYRQLWRDPQSSGFLSMAWGLSHGPRAARLPLVLYRFTGEDVWKQRVLHGLDWEFGCNATGRSFTTGIGSVYPVIFQHIHSKADGILEAIPGFTPYAPTGVIPFQASTQQFAILEGMPHSSMKHYFPPSAFCLIPESAGRQDIQAQIDTLPNLSGDEAYRIVRNAVGPKIPVMRRFYVHPTHSPGHNEFTVNESLSPHAAVLGAFLPDGWMPSEELKIRQPLLEESELPLYPQP